MTEERYLTSDDLMDRYSISYTTLWRYCRDGTLPSPKKLGRFNRWPLSVIEQYDAEHLSAA